MQFAPTGYRAYLKEIGCTTERQLHVPLENKNVPVEKNFVPVEKKFLPIEKKFLPVEKKFLPVKLVHSPGLTYFQTFQRKKFE
jgi:hypothetical protein